MLAALWPAGSRMTFAMTKAVTAFSQRLESWVEKPIMSARNTSGNFGMTFTLVVSTAAGN